MIENKVSKARKQLKEILPKQLKLCRENAGLSMHTVAKIINKTAATISKWESGDIMPYGETLLELCDLYNVDITAFFGIKPNELRLTPSEIELIKKYRNSTKNAQITVKTILETFQINKSM